MPNKAVEPISPKPGPWLSPNSLRASLTPASPFPVSSVAQICNLLCRRFVIGRASDRSSALAFADARQNAILRYGRLQICTTLVRCRVGFTLPAALFLTGCRGAPSINVLGSFFPGWMLCMGLGLVGALGLRQVFVKTSIESHLVPRPLVYLCLWGLVTLSSWLLFFRS
jgi:hypothetical protein